MMVEVVLEVVVFLRPGATGGTFLLLLLHITKLAHKNGAISAWLLWYVEKYDLLGAKYQAVAYLLSLSSREECGLSALAGGERELNKSVHAGEQKKGTRDTSGEVLWGSSAKFMEYSRVCELRKSQFVPCALTKRRLFFFFNLILPIYSPTGCWHRQEREGSQVLWHLRRYECIWHCAHILIPMLDLTLG